MGQLYPALTALADIAISAMEAFNGLDTSLGGAASKKAVAAFESVTNPLLVLAVESGLIPLKSAFRVAALYNSLTGKSGTPAPGMSGDSLTGKSGTPAPGMSGDSLTGKSGTPAPGMSGDSLTQRLHNPGGLKFANQPGATLGEGGFAKFETEEAGIAAQNDLLNKKASQGMNTLRKLIYGSNGSLGWLGSPSGQDYKDAPSYLADMVKRTGMNPDQVISNWDLVRRAQAGHEASTTNTISVSNQINTLNVHTQATDPDGIAKDMNAAIQQRAVIDYGIVGNQ